VADLILTDVSPIGPVLIMGAGSIGCYLGGRLALAGHDVHFVGRPRVLDQLRARGLTITEPDGSSATLAWLCRKFILLAMYMLNDRSSRRWPGPPAER